MAEVCHLKLKNINYRLRPVEVLGKGHEEGKWKSVQSDTDETLNAWMKERRRL